MLLVATTREGQHIFWDSTEDSTMRIEHYPIAGSPPVRGAMGKVEVRQPPETSIGTPLRSNTFHILCARDKLHGTVSQLQDPNVSEPASPVLLDPAKHLRVG